MKITDIEAFQVGWAPDDRPQQRSAFVRVHTDDGLSGIGEASPMQGGVASLGIVARDVAPTLIGQDPLDHAVLLDRAFHSFVKLGPEGALTGALAALDIALWDLKGKLLGQPIFKLLGGAWRTSLPFYASIGGNGVRSIDEVLRVVEARLEDNPAAVKIRFDNDRTRLDGDIPGDVAKARAVRKLVGDGFPLAFDAIMATRPAVQSASAAPSKSSTIGGSRSRCSTTTSRRWARSRSGSTSPSRPASRPTRSPGSQI
jgi:L-alanine-DL-glutamate epimerase-like enolase superfamily enzyme